MTAPIVIIGTGLAGFQLARAFRNLNKTTPLTLITADAGHYYPKPQLSTALTQKKTPEMLVTADAPTMAKQLNAEILTHTKVTHLDPKKKQVHYQDKSLTYHKLVLAVGALTLNPPLSGDAVHAVLSVNHIYHYANFLDQLKNKKTIAILGAGLIGSEFANDLSNAGFKVHVIAPATAPLDLLLPSSIGQLLQKALENNGVEFHLPCTVIQINKKAEGFHLTLSDSSTLEADLVLSAIGLKPHIDLAKEAHLKTDRGILVDRYLTTSHPDIYAIGDCAEVEGHVLPYITPILHCTRALAQTLNEQPTAVEYPAMPVVVKTPAHPIVVCPPPKHMKGNWQIETHDNNTKALFFNEQQQLFGFILTNEAVKERAAFAKQIPALF